MNISKTLSSGTAILLAAVTGTAYAAPIAYTDFAAFQAAATGAGLALDVQDFEGLGAYTSIADGETVDGVTYHYDLGGGELMTTDAFDTVSPSNSLGSDLDVLFGGDAFSMSFGADTGAIGLFVISPDSLLDGDVTLTAGGVTAMLASLDVQDSFGDGGQAYFLGLVDAGGSFPSATLSSGNGAFEFNVDNINSAAANASSVPLPGTLSLFLAGLSVGFGRRRCRSGE